MLCILDHNLKQAEILKQSESKTRLALWAPTVPCIKTCWPVRGDDVNSDVEMVETLRNHVPALAILAPPCLIWWEIWLHNPLLNPESVTIRFRIHSEEPFGSYQVALELQEFWGIMCQAISWLAAAASWRLCWFSGKVTVTRLKDVPTSGREIIMCTTICGAQPDIFQTMCSWVSLKGAARQILLHLSGSVNTVLLRSVFAKLSQAAAGSRSVFTHFIE